MLLDQFSINLPLQLEGQREEGLSQYSCADPALLHAL